MLTVKCPTCQTAVIWGPDAAFRPFCSERCRLIDLGAWADESHRIADKPLADLTPEQALALHDEFDDHAVADDFFLSDTPQH